MNFGNILVLTIFGLVYMTSKVEAAKKKVICYWKGEVDGSEIDADICTHIIIASNPSIGYISEGGNVMFNYDTEEIAKRNIFQATQEIRSRNPNLKILVNLDCYFHMSNDGGSLDESALDNIYNFIKSHDLDGIEIDFMLISSESEFNLLQKIKQRLGSKYLLTALTFADDFWRQSSFNNTNPAIPLISKKVDFINVVTFDPFFESKWQRTTKLPLALYSKSSEDEGFYIHDWIKSLGSGVDRSKLVLGMTFHYAIQTLSDKFQNGVGANLSLSEPSERSNYDKLCEKIQKESFKVIWDNKQKSSYAVKNFKWVNYENKKSVTAKANYVKNYGLGGAMFWSMDFDDFDGSCGTGKFPLISEVSKIFKVTAATTTTTTKKPTTTSTKKPTTTTTKKVTTTTTPQPTTTTTLRTTTQGASNGVFTCPGDGLYKDPQNCGKYYVCANGNLYSLSCPQGLLFNDSNQSCDWPIHVSC